MQPPEADIMKHVAKSLPLTLTLTLPLILPSLPGITVKQTFAVFDIACNSKRPFPRCKDAGILRQMRKDALRQPLKLIVVICAHHCVQKWTHELVRIADDGADVWAPSCCLLFWLGLVVGQLYIDPRFQGTRRSPATSAPKRTAGSQWACGAHSAVRKAKLCIKYGTNSQCVCSLTCTKLE